MGEAPVQKRGRETRAPCVGIRSAAGTQNLFGRVQTNMGFASRRHWRKGLAEGPGRGRSNGHTLLGITAIPSGNHIRAMLDGAPTDHFDRVFSTILKDIDRRNSLKSFRHLGGRVLIALVGRVSLCAGNASVSLAKGRRTRTLQIS